MHYDVVIIGAGAAGMLCAIEAGKRGRSVLIIEHADRVGKKIAISGGGRCNFTNINTRPENFISQNPNFCKSALARYTPQDFIDLVDKHGIKFHEKKLGQLFCDNSARQIIQMLLDECEWAGVTIELGCEVKRVEKNDGFQLNTTRGDFSCESLVIASGGMSIPKMGATGFGYQVARQFGLSIVSPRPGLVPMAWDEEERIWNVLSGVSIDSVVASNGNAFRENILLTHRGLSGPAILQASSYWSPGHSIHINLLPELDARELIESNRGPARLASVLSSHVPQRFASLWCERYAPDKPLSQYSKKEVDAVAERLHDWKLTFHCTEGFGKAEVTVGGVNTAELSSKTMGAIKVPGLFFIGEVVDVTGWLGGYNFQWAWASGYAAGQFV